MNRQAKLFCVYGNLEVAQGAREDIQKGLSLILREIARRASNQGDPSPERIRRDMESEGAAITSLTDFLAQ
ncbi:MAG: hypothetical protein HY721_31990 [Planctomycetes bacterium]|nr:hypothetical protein [Planctomycetota bacterium]